MVYGLQNILLNHLVPCDVMFVKGLDAIWQLSQSGQKVDALNEVFKGKFILSYVRSFNICLVSCIDDTYVMN